MQDVIREIWAAFGNYNYPLLFLGCIIIGMIAWKEKRGILFLPAILLMIVVVNPWFYRLWGELNDYGYWRMLWMLPVVTICAAVPALLAERTEEKMAKYTGIAAFFAVFIFAGSLMYDHPQTTFVRAGNADKLPVPVVKAADVLLEKEEYPRVVSDVDLAIYMRQYSGRIQSAYARDIVFEIPTPQAVQMHNALEGEDYGELHRLMTEYDYTYLVTRNEGKEETLEGAGFEKLEQVEEYGVYRR